MKKRIGVFGWGVVAPQARNIDEFTTRLNDPDSCLAPFEGYGPNNFLVGNPDLSFDEYKSWFERRFPSSKYLQIVQKMDGPSLYAIAAFIQSLDQNKGIEQELQSLESQAHVYIGTSYGNVDAHFKAAIAVHRAQRRWDHFWAQPCMNSARQTGCDSSDAIADHRMISGSKDPECEDEAEFEHYWAERSPELHAYLTELAKIESQPMDGKDDAAKRQAFAEKERAIAKLQERVGAPEPPWRVSGNAFWNLHNTPAAQISILGKIKGLSLAPVAACSSFAVALRLAMTAIDAGEAKAVVIGATDPAPHPLTISCFYSARVLSADGTVSLPLSAMRGTHLSGGAVVWIVGDYEYMRSRGFSPVGMEPLAVGTTSDSDHLITPSTEGPQSAIQQALREAELYPNDIRHWDLHATGTPGDLSEFQTFKSVFPENITVTARKAFFGHGLAVAGGWELTAQYLGYEQGYIFPTNMQKPTINNYIWENHSNFVCGTPEPFPCGAVGKLSMGLGGINACVISRPW